MRKFLFETGGHYHLYNRGVDKRTIFEDKEDGKRFLQSLAEFNTTETIGSIYENSFKKDTPAKNGLVNIIAFCLNPNHYHLIVEQVCDKGIEKFMQRLGTGYTLYFNNKYDRSGTLFQGKYKAKNIADNDYLLLLSVYVNLNDRIHSLGGSTSKLVNNSWKEYVSETTSASLCQKDLILDQFSDKKEYEKFALDLLPSLIESKTEKKEIEYLT